MDDALRQLVAELHREGQEYDATQADRLRRRRNLEPETAALVSVVVQAMGAIRILEVGTSNGYSTIWFADAVRRHGGRGGRVVSVDTDADTQADAAKNLDRVGLASWVDLLNVDGGEHLRALDDRSHDVVFLDSERTEYAGWWPHPKRVLRPGGLLLVDNVLSHPDEVAELQDLMAADPDLMSTVVPVGKGLLTAVVAAPAP